jgi:hypothetical protein
MIGELVPFPPRAEPVARLRRLRGVDTLSAVGSCAEVGGLPRFESRARLMHHLRLVQARTAQARPVGKARSRRPAPATPAGCSSRRPRTTAARKHTTLQRRQERLSTQAIVSWKAQERLQLLWRRLESEREKRRTLV